MQILDDHEIKDNFARWLDGQGGVEEAAAFSHAMMAYNDFQASFAPPLLARSFGYNFTRGEYPFFVLDTRSERQLYKDHSRLADNVLMGAGQLREFEAWVQRWPANTPKFVVSASLFFPNQRNTVIPKPKDSHKPLNPAKVAEAQKNALASDTWSLAPTTRAQFLEILVRNKTQNVVLLQGDIHSSLAAEATIQCKDGGSLKLFSIVASPFYWPFPFAHGPVHEYVHDSSRENDTIHFDHGSMDYKILNKRGVGWADELLREQDSKISHSADDDLAFTMENSFARVTVVPDPDSENKGPTVRVDWFDSDPDHEGPIVSADLRLADSA